MTRLYTDLRALRYLSKRVPTPDGKGFSTENDGMEELTYDVYLGGLDTIARRAARNKSGKSKNGPILVKVTKRRRVL